MFSTLEILEEFAETTARVPGGEVWWSQCERVLWRKRAMGRKSYQKWISKPSNQLRKLAYMYLYDRTPNRMEAKRLLCKRRRAANRAMNPLPPRPDPKYKKGCKRVESKEVRRARYLRAKATGYLKKRD